MDNKPAVLKSLLLVAILAVLAVAGCDRVNELVMGYTTPEWRSVATLRDGRKFVTDGTIALDVKIAEIADEDLPPEESAAWFSDALYQHSIAERQELFSLKDIKDLESSEVFVMGPGNLKLEQTYVTYLSNRYGSSHRIAFWQHSSMQPIVIVVNGEGAGAMKPFSQN